ncbi:FkbM family methyltransferase [Xanthobacter tagetidis]|nr:FkbM family methyltransferase [Xanthobacter tagetidis]MBB6306231.1 FkbM family methyltransferase [Xanthobacter tagetidis]
MGSRRMGMIERNGFWWPSSDDWCWRVIHQELPDVDRAVSFCRGHAVAIQAGGNVGVWAAHLARTFAHVETAEPMADNYACLQRNVPSNVNHRRACFGAKPGAVAMEAVTGNAGAHYVREGGDTPVITIDAMELHACDLICLDVEGYEPFALQGAEDTIRRFRPVIMFEEKGLSERYFGIPRGACESWVLGLGLGYEVKDRVRKDVILAC